MKISYNWLKKYLDLKISAEEIANLLTDIGLEVEKIEHVESIKGGLKGVVIGQILTKVQHPNADRLSLTTVNIGKDTTLQIICGAPNVEVGQKVPVATVGTILYNNDIPLKIKKGKIRGELSLGMICSEMELGLGNNHDGIMILDKSAKTGMLASDYFNIKSDLVFDIGLTPNRSDAMGHIGVARDLLTVLNYKGSKLQMCKPSVDKFKIDNTNNKISVEVKDRDLCPRYSGLSISGIKISESPSWLQNNLKAIGVNPINNIVDITNYVLHETGQPLHAFDIAKIKGNKIIVSTIKQNTKFTTLDSIKRDISSEDLMINNSNNPMCIAGVYGGIDSGVTNKTTDIFLESAYFNPINIRKTSKRHNLKTDASFRYERGCDPNITIYALKRAALLITEICGGKISSNIIDIYNHKIPHFPVFLSYKNMDQLIGEVIDRKIVKNILNDLEIIIKKEKKDGLNLLVPPFKSDVKREVDIIEEILRIYGYNNIKIPLTLNNTILYSDGVNKEKIRDNISDLLSNNGFFEIMNNSLTSNEYTKLLPELKTSQNIELLNPLSKDLNIMRQSLLFGALESVAYNQNRKNTDLKLYEFGKTYHKKENKTIENQHLLLLATGKIKSENWNNPNQKIDFYYIKEKVEHILNKLNIKNWQKKDLKTNGFSQGLIYISNEKPLVYFGKINDNLCSNMDIKSEIFAADFNWDLILSLVSKNKVKYEKISKFPEVRRDLSLLIDKSINFDQLKSIANKIDNKLLKSINLFDVYEGNKLPKGKKSYALSFIMADKEKTLTDKRVDKLMNKLIQSYTEKLGAEIR